jgi:hypothetical protein
MLVPVLAACGATAALASAPRTRTLSSRDAARQRPAPTRQEGPRIRSSEATTRGRPARSRYSLRRFLWRQERCAARPSQSLLNAGSALPPDKPNAGPWPGRQGNGVTTARSADRAGYSPTASRSSSSVSLRPFVRSECSSAPATCAAGSSSFSRTRCCRKSMFADVSQPSHHRAARPRSHHPGRRSWTRS